MIECSRCDNVDRTPASSISNLPEGWAAFQSERLGVRALCPDCMSQEEDTRPSLRAKLVMVADDGRVQPQSLENSSKEKLKLYVSKIEALEEEKSEINEQLKEVYADAKALGFDTKALKFVIRRRKKDPQSLQEEEMMQDLYLHALGEI